MKLLAPSMRKTDTLSLKHQIDITHGYLPSNLITFYSKSLINQLVKILCNRNHWI